MFGVVTPVWRGVFLCGQAHPIRAFRFAIRITNRFESIRFVKKLAFRFTITGFCIMNNVFQCLWSICYLKHNNR